MTSDLFLRRTRAVLTGVTAPRAIRADPRDIDPAGATDRQAWIALARRLADPVLGHLAQGTLRARMPVEQVPDTDRGQRERTTRYAAIQERLIGPDGTYPLIGRSLAYRVGAFHALARTSLHHLLPDELDPAQVRGALTAAIGRTMDVPGTFDDARWLRIGVAGHQPGIGESYVSTGSLYLCAQVLLPLGLPPTDRFWASPAVAWTSQRAWSGLPFPIDRALETRGRKR